nr:TBC1 domain family member 15-like isoform X2 [Onthophagus taurus]
MSRHPSQESTTTYLQPLEDLRHNADLNRNEDYPKINELFCQDGVLLESGPASHIEYIRAPGTLFITRYENCDSSSLYVEWKPLESFTIESDTQDQEWAVVNTIEKRTRTLSGSLLPEEANRSKYLKIKLSEVKSYKLGTNHRKLTFNDGSGESLCSFSFQNGNSDCFNNVLRQYIKTAPARRDKNHYVIIGEITEAENQFKKTFGELSLFPDEQPHYMWYLMKNFQQDPLEITKAAFARMADIVLASHGEREMEDDVKALLNKSITTLESTTTTQGEYEIVTNVSELPDRKDFPRSRPLTKEQWIALQDCHGRIEDVETTKLTIFRGGVTPELRTKVWKYLLNYFDWDSTQQDRENVYKIKEAEYFKMKKQWMSMSKFQEDNFSDYRDRKSIIEKDVNRTDRHMDFYGGDDNVHLQQLHDILMTYVMYNFDLGYVQGMSDLLSPILYLMQSEIDAFWCFAGFMEKVNNNFDVDQAGMKAQLQHLHTLLQFIDPELLNYLDTHESGNMFFCFRWLLVWFKRELEMEDVMRLWEVLWTGLPCKNFHLLISVAILLNEKSAIIENDYGFTEILKHVNELSLKLDVNKIINEAEGIYYQIKEATHATDAIKDIIGLPRPENNQVDSPNTNSFTYLDDSDRTETVYEKSITNNFY